MPRKKKSKGRPRTKRQNKKQNLLPAERESIFQLYAAGMSKAEIARQVGCTRQTVYKYIAEYKPSEVSAARADMALELSGKTTKLAERALGSITDEDLQNASLSQKAVVAGIMIDKTAALDKMRRELAVEGESGSASNGIPLPDEASGMIQLIKNRIKSIEVLRVQLRDEEGEAAIKAAEQLMEQAQEMALSEDDEIEDAEWTDVTNLRNPPKKVADDG